jgi:hypothetical protein
VSQAGSCCSAAHPHLWQPQPGHTDSPSPRAPLLLPLPVCSKVLVRPARHKIFNLHVGEQERFESNNIVFTK